MFIDRYQSVIFDIDGTLLYGDKPISGAAEIIDYLSKRSRKLYFLTNNSTDSSAMIRRKLNSAGLRIPKDAPIITAGDITSAYLIEKYGKSRLAVIGSESLKKRLEEDHIINWETPDFLVHGRHLKLCYDDIKKGMKYLERGASLVLTNVDLTQEYSGDISPETGILAAALVRYAGEKFESPGKPSEFAFSYILNKYRIKRRHTIFIGDNLDTDIKGANDSGLASIFLNHSGNTVRDNQPSLVVSSLSRILEV